MTQENKIAITGPKQPYGRVFIEILLDETLSTYAKLCYAVMTSFGPDPTTWASVGSIGKRMSVSGNTVRQAQRDLETSGWMVRGKEIPGTTVHWKMLAPFERHPSYREGVHKVEGGASPVEGGGFTGGSGGVHAVNAKQEDKHELNNHEKKQPQKSPPQKKNNEPEQKSKQNLQELSESIAGKLFKKIHDEKEETSYFFDYKDLSVFDQAKALGLPEAKINTALVAFFDSTSWHWQNGHVRFFHFIRNAQTYGRNAGRNARVTQEDLSNYYEPWDPRHPYYTSDDPSIRQQLQSHEITHGKWIPKPDWKPKEQ